MDAIFPDFTIRTMSSEVEANSKASGYRLTIASTIQIWWNV